MPIPSAIITLVLGMILVLGGLWIGQNINLLPVDASVNAPIYDELFRVLFSIGTILFVGIVGLVVFMAGTIQFYARWRRLREAALAQESASDA